MQLVIIKKINLEPKELNLFGGFTMKLKMICQIRKYLNMNRL